MVHVCHISLTQLCSYGFLLLCMYDTHWGRYHLAEAKAPHRTDNLDSKLTLVRITVVVNVLGPNGGQPRLPQPSLGPRAPG